MTTVGAPGVSSAMRSSPFVPIVALAALGLLALPARARSVALRVLDASDAPAPAPRVTTASTASARATRTVSGRCLPAPRCAAAELDLDGICLPSRLDAPGDVPADLVTNSHTDRTGRLVVYEHIPRRPDLPAEYNRYEYPVPPWHGRTVTSRITCRSTTVVPKSGPT